MNLNEILKKTIAEKQPTTAKKYLYHVTFTKNVPNIKKKGLIQFQPSNWVKGPGGDRYNNDIAGIFAFDHPEDALNWAGKMEWEFRDTDKDMSIVRIDMEDFWEDDPAEDPFVSNKGKARYSPRDIKADKIIDVLDMSGIKRPGDLGISRDEWLANVSKKLTELHGGGGIPDYTTMPAYGLKRAKKGKHKFFVPKGEKLPAGVGAIKEGMAGEERYHDYTIKYILAPNAQGIYRGIIHPPKNLKDTLEAKRLEATSIDELIHSAKEWIESGFSPSRSWSEVPADASVTLDLNSSFMLDSLGVNAVHYIKLSQINGRPVLLVAPDDAIENYGSNEVEKKQGYKKTTTKSLGTSSSFMSKAKAKEIGLKPNGRYTLEKSNKKTDNMGSDIYSMVFNSIVSPTKEQKRLSVPAVTIAVNRSTRTNKIKEADEDENKNPVGKSYANQPIVYVDMDGVLVDFFGEWANMHGVESWRDIRPLLKKQGKTIDDALDEIRARDDFWINLKQHTGAKALLAAIKKHAGEYIILSSPLSNDPNSIPQKRAWVKNNLSAFPPKEVIIHKRKQDYATQTDGTPNILIDDYSSQVKPWAAAGGIALKHSNSNIEKTVNALRQQFESTTEEAWKVKVPTKKKRKMSKQDKDWSMLRTAFESDLFEAGTGDCFEIANRAMIDITEEQEVYGMKCVHAYVYGQGDLKGRRFPHAWNEQGDVVFDNSNGNNIVMRKEQYYALGGVVQESGAYATYDKEDCLIKMLKHSHYGPWDLNDSLDENIPDEAKEIGKEKSRIPRNLLNTIKNELNLETQVESAWERFKSNVA